VQRDRWHLGLLAREAGRNVAGRGSRMLPVLALAVLTGAGSTAFVALETQQLRTELADLAADGRGVLLVSAASPDAPARIDRASCEALTGQPGIARAGVLEPADRLDLLPVGTRLPAQRASTTLFPELAGADLLVGSALSDRTDGTFYVTTGGSDGEGGEGGEGGEVTTAVHAGPHPEGLGSTFTITLPPDPGQPEATGCAVVLDELTDTAAALPAVTAQLGVTGNPVAAIEVLRATNDPAADYLDRTSRWLPVLLGLIGAVATAITTRLRASEIAVYRMSGTSPTSVMTLLAFESLLLAGTAAIAATAAALALTLAGPTGSGGAGYFLDPTVPVLWGLALAGTWATATLFATTDLAVRRPDDLAKDR
jgi:hypothetical protein